MGSGTNDSHRNSGEGIFLPRMLQKSKVGEQSKAQWLSFERAHFRSIQKVKKYLNLLEQHRNPGDTKVPSR